MMLTCNRRMRERGGLARQRTLRPTKVEQEATSLYARVWNGRMQSSVVLGFIVVAGALLLAGREQVELAVALTVLLSVLLYGVTAGPLSATYTRKVEGMAAGVSEKEKRSRTLNFRWVEGMMVAFAVDVRNGCPAACQWKTLAGSS
jgi:hypothetical protein